MVTHIDRVALLAEVDGGQGLLAAERSGDVPPLPVFHRIGGTLVADSGLVRAWLDSLPAHRGSLSERKAREQAEARLHHEAATRERLARNEREFAQGRERAAQWA